MVIHKNTVQNNLAVLNAQENIIQRSAIRIEMSNPSVYITEMLIQQTIEDVVQPKRYKKIKNRQIKKMILPTQPQRNSQTDMNSRNNTTRNNAATKSYSQAVQGKADNISNSSQVQQKVPIDIILQQILEKINKLDERISLMEQRLQGAKTQAQKQLSN